MGEFNSRGLGNEMVHQVQSSAPKPRENGGGGGEVLGACSYTEGGRGNVLAEGVETGSARAP